MSYEVCKKHPKYKVLQQPRSACATCWLIWFITRYGDMPTAAHDLFFVKQGIQKPRQSAETETP